MKITSTNITGRMLIALRAGRMTREQLDDAFPGKGTTFSAIIAAGLVEKINGYWQLTPAGRNACPNRRDQKPAPKGMSKAERQRADRWASARQQCPYKLERRGEI